MVENKTIPQAQGSARVRSGVDRDQKLMIFLKRNTKQRPLFRRQRFQGQRLALSIFMLGVGIGAGNWVMSHLFSKNSSQNLTTPLGGIDSTQQHSLDKNQIVANPVANEGLNKVIVFIQQQAQSQLLTWDVPARFQGKTLAEAKLPPNDKVIALTFDDGPWPRSTEQVLSILKQHNIKATFFLIGQNVKNYPQLAIKDVAEGHVIANHTWSHSYSHFSPDGAAREIEDTAALIYKTTGVTTTIFRPPGGLLHNGPADYAKKQKYFISLWSADSRDWQGVTVPKLIDNVLKEAHPGGIVLMHDGGGNRSHTVEALPTIIAKLKNRGYSFVTVPELLDLEDKELTGTDAKIQAKPATSSKLPHVQAKVKHSTRLAKKHRG
ncbi:MAG: hypothetical protein NVS2B14_13750 [Chamaesiphon sp.]